MLKAIVELIIFLTFVWSLMTIHSLDFVHPNVVSRYLKGKQAFEEKYPRYPLKEVETFRTEEQQLVYYMKGRKKNSSGDWIMVQPKLVVTRCPPGYSWHNYGLAIDVAFEGDDPYLEDAAPEECEVVWEAFGSEMVEAGLVWGGHFTHIVDRPHVEQNYGLTLTEAIALNQRSGPMGVWSRIDSILNCGKSPVE